MDESSFFSLDKLVEFGMGVAVATQMAASMNSSLACMPVPGVQNQMRGASGYAKHDAPQLYYVAVGGEALGPFAPSELSGLIERKQLTSQTYVWAPGMTDWDLAQNVPDILEIVALTPPPVPGA
ncbi:DUF4339 domain-containing protein [uncultured Adlercreutzia sp.]|uniref:DUF4339 domain-containing protein n=1 Tax=uncultured Adlercreutzia sp. TaxID=875803 RepID=UPI0025D0E168|nr:DUF4339 domain-containing protein [uncultured Adlercreutzia sp.]